MKIHFIGIKGVGMTALAVAAKEKGYEVSGSDEAENFVTENELKKAEIIPTLFNPENLNEKPDFVVVSAAYGSDNIEFKEAKKKHLEILAYSEMLAKISEGSTVIAVAGIHGKTTTTALLSFLLKKADLDPSFVVGAGEVPSLGASAHSGAGEFFIVEADEYRKSEQDTSSKFLDLKPKYEIITSIELDHPDIFATDEEVYNAFYKFVCKVPRTGFIVLCADYTKTRKLERSIADRNFETYGFSNFAAWKIVDFIEDEKKTSFAILNGAEKLGPFKISLPGEGNVLNATAAIITALKLGVHIDVIIKSLPLFSGVGRRYQKIGQVGEIAIFDDYAHHPRAIQITLESLKRKYPSSQIWCIFQPHTYSRTKKLLEDFSLAFASADKIYITEIYSSAREKEATISGENLALAIKKNNKSVKFINNWGSIVREITSNVKEPAVIITIGAGDIHKLSSKIYDELKNA